MNMFMVKKLVAKDWYFNRHILIAYTVGGLAALTLMFSGSEAASAIGSIMVVTAIIAFGCHLVMGTVVAERKNQTLPFVMSLPVTITDYTVAKMVANLTTFVVPWLLISFALMQFIKGTDSAPNGLIPVFTIMLVEMFIAYLVMLTVALISESEGWTIVSMVVMNTCFSLVFMGLGRIDGIGNFQNEPEAHWTPEVFTALGIEVAIIAALIAATFYFQNRKTEFL
ncbi:MAG: hypothetical protein EP335_13770 [Alphaproteobacteria bacterium]|nr:MAG: hypothetical protein EP335_13770 [Alphaproteobacteria bacterium]